MLVPISRAGALLFENIYFKRMAFFFFFLSNRGCKPAAFGKNSAYKFFCWACRYVCLFFFYCELVARVLKVGTSNDIVDLWLLLKNAKVGLLGVSLPRGGSGLRLGGSGLLSWFQARCPLSPVSLLAVLLVLTPVTTPSWISLAFGFEAPDLQE